MAAPTAPGAPTHEREMTKLVDVTKCIGCRGCQNACKAWWDLPAEVGRDPWSGYQSHKDLSFNRYTLVKYFERTNAQGNLTGWQFMKTGCFHCADPACQKVCPVEAVSKRDSGAVVIDQEKCIGCGYCAYNCPFGVPKVNSAGTKASKCSLCSVRTENKMKPSCAQTCPTGAVIYGPRKEILEMASARLDLIKKAHPVASLYNPEGVGGTHTIYLLPDAPEAFGLAKAPEIPVSISVWKDFVRPVGATMVGAALIGVLAGLFINTGKGSSHSQGGAADV